MTAPHDDCAALRIKCAALEAALRGYCACACDGLVPRTGFDCAKFPCKAGIALSGEPTALREMVAAAFDAGFSTRDNGEPWDGYEDGEGYAERILKGGGR